MYSEKQIREILHEFKMRKENLILKVSNPELKTLYWTDYISQCEKVILLETILEESAWQKLMNEHKKENVFIRRFNIMCDYLFRRL